MVISHTAGQCIGEWGEGYHRSHDTRRIKQVLFKNTFTGNMGNLHGIPHQNIESGNSFSKIFFFYWGWGSEINSY